MADDAVFWFDFGSPYAYLAAERIDDFLPNAEWKPFAFPILLGHIGELEERLVRGPGKAREVTTARAAERGLPPLNPPPTWPVESWSLHPLRAALYADEQGRLKEFSQAAFRKVFVEGRALTDIDNLRAAAEAGGLDPQAIEDAIQRPEIKQRLKDHTEEAIALGVPGIPTVAIGDRFFWGDDRLEEAAAASGA